MNPTKRSSSLIIDRDSVLGSVSVTGSVSHGDDPAIVETIGAALEGDRDVVIILTRDKPAEVVPSEAGEPAEPASPLQAVAVAVARALGQKQSMLGLIEQLSPATEVLSPPAVLQARRNADARRALMEEHGTLTAAEVSDLAGSLAHNRSALPARWRKEGRVFGVQHHGVLRYPVFQFGADGRPLPLLAEILQAFHEANLGEWEIALWFTSRNGWLADKRPTDLLHTDPESVSEAARHEVEPVAG